MSEKPILFNGDMVRAILSGAKTQTRRPVKVGAWPTSASVAAHSPEPEDPGVPNLYGALFRNSETGADQLVRSPFGQPGGTMWVRETARLEFTGDSYGVVYRAGGCSTGEPDDSMLHWIENGPWIKADDLGEDGARTPWRPSIHMPRGASRVTLRVKRVWVERVQEISEADAIAEGAFGASDNDKQPAARVAVSEGRSVVGARDYFQQLWDSIYAKRPGLSWADSPWAWCCEFELDA